MDKKTRDCVCSLILILLGGFVLQQGLAMVERASKPPYRIQHFSVSPGMMPTILGGCLIFFSLLLLINTLRGERNIFSALFGHLKTFSIRFGHAFGKADIRSMIVSVVIMAVYTFGILGRFRFSVGAMVFLVGLMLFLRSAKHWVILASSAASVFAIILLFETFFKTSLP